MNKKMLLVVGVTLFALWSVAPSIIYFMQPPQIRNNSEELKKKIPSWLPNAHIKLGLDLQGGVQLVLGVNTSGAVENKLSRMGTEIVRWAQDNKQPVKTAYVVKGEGKLRVELDNADALGSFKEALKTQFYGLEQVSRKDNIVDFAYDDAQMKHIKQGALEQAERVIRSRVDQWGVTEPIINRRADGSVLVQLPGFSDPEKAKDLLGRTAQLRFKIVDDEFKGFESLANKPLPEGITMNRSQGSLDFVGENKDALTALLKEFVPADRELLFQREDIAGGKKAKFTSYVVKAATEISGEDVLDSMVTSDNSSLDNRPAVSLKFTGPGGKRFADVTGANVQKRMAILLDDEVVSAPVINQKISGGNALINLGRGPYQEVYEEATRLSLILKSGALPATIEVLEERQVGASLGPELAEQGIYAIIVGLLFVFGFMFLYYRIPGLVACAALTLNGLYLLSLMAGFGSALTLPGIAGFILTLGMAVDANVLINERIRQELKEGKSAKKALANGFDKVFWTIFDSNVTTLIAALVLMETNPAGPIRGFAVTLIIGLLVSMFTALYCTRFMFEFLLRNKTQDAAVRRWFGLSDKSMQKPGFNFDFLKYSKTVGALGIVIALAIIGIMSTAGLNWAVDFAGGTEIEMQFAKAVAPKQLRDIADKTDLKDVSLQSLEGKDMKYLIRIDNTNKTDKDIAAKNLASTISKELADYKPEINRIDYVGPQIGKELRNQGILSVFFALIGILVYIALRFDLRFAPGSIVKMVQDVFVMMGFYVFFWRSFDLTSVAALLSVIGYSINDTIVIYDRIRENLTMHPKRSMRENVNISINETLARAINTSVSTLVSLFGILIFGTAQIWNFAAAMAIGVISATTTSAFVATGCIIWFDNWRRAKNQRKVTVPA